MGINTLVEHILIKKLLELIVLYAKFVQIPLIDIYTKIFTGYAKFRENSIEFRAIFVLFSLFLRISKTNLNVEI